MAKSIRLELNHLLAVALVLGLRAMERDFKPEILSPFELVNKVAEVSRPGISTQLKTHDWVVVLLKEVNCLLGGSSIGCAVDTDQKLNGNFGKLTFHFADGLNYCVNVHLFRNDLADLFWRGSEFKISTILFVVIFDDLPSHSLECRSVCDQLRANLEDLKRRLDINVVKVNVVSVNSLGLCQLQEGHWPKTASDMGMKLDLWDVVRQLEKGVHLIHIHCAIDLWQRFLILGLWNCHWLSLFVVVLKNLIHKRGIIGVLFVHI
jgi:hypothetical protein